MSEQQIPFQVGDQVIHWAHGPGRIIQLEEKTLYGHTRQYYVVEMSNFKLWVPVNQIGTPSLRLPITKEDFEDLIQILSSPGKPLAPDRKERRLQLIERLKDHKLASLFKVIRDLTFYKRLNRLNDNDRTILARSQKTLVDEWRIASSISTQQAEEELKKLLEGDEKIT